MTGNVCTFDASILRISDDAAVKVTFLKSDGGGHFTGFYSVADGAVQDVRTLFANVGGESSLIPGVSSVFLGNRLNGKTPVFFVIENGYALNKDTPWFLEAAAGRGGVWKFLKPASRKNLIPDLFQGHIVWRQADGETVEQAQNAQTGTEHPVLVWQSNGGQVYMVKGKVFHSSQYGLLSDVNPDRHHRFTVTPQEDGTSVVLDFTDAAEQKTVISINLQLGRRSLEALTRNRVVGALTAPLQIRMPVLSVTVEIPDDFDDSLYLEGFDGQKTIPLAGENFIIDGSGTNRLTITGNAVSGIYECLLACVKIKTNASAPAKSDVSMIFHTEKEDFVFKGKTDILSEEGQAAAVLAGLPLSKSASDGKTVFPSTIFNEKLPHSFEKSGRDDNLPSFLTQPVAASAAPAVKKVSNGKTVLITGGAGKRGASVAHAFASRGYDVIVHCNASAAQATHLVEELKQKYHVKASYFRADFNSYEETADLIPAVMKTYGPVDVLVCQASAFVPEESESGWDLNMAVNLRAPFVLMRSFSLCLPKGREGTVVSVFSQMPSELSSYALACASLPQLTALAAEICKNRMTFSALAVSGYRQEEAQNQKIAETVCFLAQNPLFSGQTLKLDVSTVPEKKTSLF